MLEANCPRTTIDQLPLPDLSAKLLKSLSIIVYLFILILVRTSLEIKRNHSTDVLKEIIDAYRVLNGSVFTCFFRCERGILPNQSFHFAITLVNMVTQQQCVATVISSDVTSALNTDTTRVTCVCLYTNRGYAKKSWPIVNLYKRCLAVICARQQIHTYKWYNSLQQPI